MLDGRATRWSVRWHGTPSWQLRGCNTPTGAQVGARGSSIRCESRKGGASGRAGCEHEFPSTGFRSVLDGGARRAGCFWLFSASFRGEFLCLCFQRRWVHRSRDQRETARPPAPAPTRSFLIHDELESGAERVEAPPGYILPRYRKSVAFMTDVSHTGPHTTSIARRPALGLGTPPIPRSTDRMQLKIVRRVFPFGA